MDYEIHKEEMDRLKYAHEGEVAILERHNKRAFIFALIVFIALILTNAGWIIHESLYENMVTTQTVTQEANGNRIALSGIGDAYGMGETDSNTDN